MSLNLAQKLKRNRWGITEKMFRSLFLTGAIIEFSQVGSGFIDGLVISRYLGPDAMAAQGIVNPVYSILGVISGLLAVGMEVRCAQAIGRGNTEEFCKFFTVTFYAGIIVSAILTPLLVLFVKPFTVMLGAAGNAASLLEPASQYLLGVSFGIPALVMTAILAPAFQLDSDGKLIQTGAIVGALVNVCIDIISVKVGWGILGIGLATALSNYVNLLIQCIHFTNKNRALHFSKEKISVKEFVQMLANGGEKAVKRLANTIRPVILNTIIISYGGTAAMTALSVRNNFSSFAEIFGAGIASAVSLLVGVYFGEINEEGIDEVRTYGHKMTFVLSGSVCALLLIFAKPIASLYISDDGEIFDMAVFGIRMLALQNPLQALIASRIKFLQATHRKSNMNALIFAAKLAFVLISAFVAGSLFGVYGILASFTLSDALSLIAIYVFYLIKTHKIIPARSAFLNLPDEFYLKPGDVISFDVCSIEEVTLTSEQIMLFCRGHKIDEKTAYYASLCFEELAANIVEHGFPKSKALHPMIDLRVVISANRFVIRLRDNCPQYDITKHMAAVNAPDADLTKNIGVRIVSKLASDINYVRTFDSNNVIISFNIGQRGTK